MQQSPWGPLLLRSIGAFKYKLITLFTAPLKTGFKVLYNLANKERITKEKQLLQWLTDINIKMTERKAKRSQAWIKEKKNGGEGQLYAIVCLEVIEQWGINSEHLAISQENYRNLWLLRDLGPAAPSLIQACSYILRCVVVLWHQVIFNYKWPEGVNIFNPSIHFLLLVRGVSRIVQTLLSSRKTLSGSSWGIWGFPRSNEMCVIHGGLFFATHTHTHTRCSGAYSAYCICAISTPLSSSSDNTR